MKRITTVCPYCASGCKMQLAVEEGNINDTQILTPRLKTPMIRRQRGGRLESVSWHEALDYVATRLSAIKEKYGPDAIQTTGSSRAAGNETNYIMQKFARAVIGTNNVDCCARV